MNQNRRWWAKWVLVGLGVAGGWSLSWWSGASQWQSQPEPGSCPTIQQVQKLGLLVSTRAQLTLVHQENIQGLTGSVQALVLVRGEVLLGVDLSQACFEQVDEQAHRAVLVLPQPQVSSSRVSHEQSRILGLQNRGLWLLVPGSQAEQAVVDRAYQQAQERIRQGGSEEELVQKAQVHASQVLGEFFKQLGWELEVRWQRPGGSTLNKAGEQ